MTRIFLVTTLLLFPAAGFAQKKPGEAARVQSVTIKGQAKPGGEVTAIVKVQLEKSYHVHSNKPSEPNFIATVLTLETAPGVKAGAVVYPQGKLEKVPGLDKPLSVYENEFELSVPLRLNSTVKLPLTIPATLRYQACQGAQCYPPERLRFDLKVADQK